MRASLIRVTTKVKAQAEGEQDKKYSAKKEIQVPSTLDECHQRFGESGIIEACVSMIEADETAKLRAKLVAKVSGEAAPATDVEEVSIDD